jgi:hypothetical protein
LDVLSPPSGSRRERLRTLDVNEVQNLLEPETDQGVPGGPDKSEAAPPAGEAMKAKPEGETKEIEKEEGK